MNGSLDHTVLAIIDNFCMSIDRIELSENLSVISIDALPPEYNVVFQGQRYQIQTLQVEMATKQSTQREFTQVHFSTGTGAPQIRTLEQGNFVLRWNFSTSEFSKEQYDILQTASREFDAALTAFRIMKPEKIGVFPEEHFASGTLEYVRFAPRSRNAPLDNYLYVEPGSTPTYILNEADIKDFRQFYEAIRSVSLPRFQVALSRLSSQYSRVDLADHLIDAVIALEALYIDDGTNELQFRMASRLATHLGGNDPDRREYLFKLATSVYTLRSKIVHGLIFTPKEIHEAKEVKKGGWENADQLLSELNDILRVALKSFLLNAADKGFTQFQKELDRAIRRGEAFET